jgi:hypothetical protein
MDVNIADQLNAKGATPEAILQILKNSVFEASGDLSQDEMRTALKKAAGDPAKIDKTLRELESKPDLVRDVALLWISQASSDATRQSAIEGAIKGADREMPIMEIGAITLVALYAIYMLSPPKPKEITWILREKPDGTYEEEVAGKYDTFDAPVKALTSLFSEGAKEG